jgi:3-phosphoshikimate 1-carboxyvinyltransferase
MSDLRIEPIQKPFTATITPPGSKSLTNRALVIAALADGVGEVSNVLFADDTQHMFDNLVKLGFELQIDRDTKTVQVHGQSGKIPASSADLFCGNSGTTIRFLAAVCTLATGKFTLDGVARMRQRPIAALTSVLKNLGALITYSENEGYPPLSIDAHGLAGGIARYGSEVSSQFLSAILMIAPYARHEVRIDLDPYQTSWPYVAMTMQLMDHFAITPELIRDPKTAEPKQIIIPRGKYAATNYTIEPDASNASYFLAAAAINPHSTITIEGLGKSSLQGDVAFADVLHRMGADLIFGKDFLTIKGTKNLEGIEVDLEPMPDTIQTLAVAALFAKGSSTIHGIHNLRVKETDRVAALSNELKKLGAEIEVEENTMTITPPQKITPAAIDTYDDHRMAMSFAIAGTRVEGITIKDSQCVNKTYPNFFDDLRKITS